MYKVPKSEPDTQEHYCNLSATPGLFKQPEEKGVQRNGRLDAVISRREFLDKVRPGIDALREKYGRPAAEIPSTTSKRFYKIS